MRRRQDACASTNTIKKVAVYHDLGGRYVANRLAIVWVTKDQHYIGFGINVSLQGKGERKKNVVTNFTARSGEGRKGRGGGGKRLLHYSPAATKSVTSEEMLVAALCTNWPPWE